MGRLSIKRPNLIVRLGYINNRNIYAFLAGIITIYLVFRGGALIYLFSKFSPSIQIYFGFDSINVTYLDIGEEIPFLTYLYISAKISYLIAGFSLLIGGLVRDPKISKMFVGFKLPSLTGLVLTLLYLFINISLGSISILAGESSVSIPIIAGDSYYYLKAKILSLITPSFIMTVTANILAILGRYASSSMSNYMERLGGLRDNLKRIFPLIPV